MQTRFDRVEFQLSDQAFQPQNQPAIGRGWIVTRLLVPDEAPTVAAQIKKLIPIGAVARQACDIIGEVDPDLPEIDPRPEFLETRVADSATASYPKVGVDDLNLGSIPAEGVSALG